MSWRSTAYPLLFAVCLTAAPSLARGADAPLRLRAADGDQAIVLSADAAATWRDGDRQMVVLDGGVMVEHGLTHLRAARAVAWVDLATAQVTKKTRLTIYADGDVRAEQDGRQSAGTSAVVEIETRGELRVRARGGKIRQESQEASKWYRDALAVVAGTGVAPAPSIQQVAAQVPATPTASVPPDEIPRVAPRPIPPAPVPSGPLLPEPSRTSNAPPGQLPPPLDPVPNAPAVPPPPGLPPGPPITVGPARPPRVEEIPLPEAAPSRIIDYAPRFASAPYQLKFLTLPSGEQAAVITGGIILTVRFPTGEVVDLEADRVVAWTRGGSTQELFGGGGAKVGGAEEKRQIEFYLAGNVEFRYSPKPEVVLPNAPVKPKGQIKVLRADRVYYDVTNNKALAVDGDLEIQQPGLKDAAHVKAGEIWQLSNEEYQAIDADIFASKLPSNPGLKVHMNRATIVERERTKRGFLGLPEYEDGEALTEAETIFSGRNIFLEVLDVPVFYFPYLQADVNDPFGPFEGFGFRQDNNFGTQFLTTWDLFQLLGLDPPMGQRARLFVDYLSERGPGGGGRYDYLGQKMFGLDSLYYGMVKGYGIYDQGFDRLSGAREQEFVPPAGRGRIVARHVQDYENLHFMGQVNYQSDHNFLESYYKPEFDLDKNQETFAYLKWQPGNVATTILAEPNLERYWVNETQWLPRVEGRGIGVSFFEVFTYNVRAGAGYADTVIPVTPANSPVQYPPQLSPTDVAIQTGRFNLGQELDLPLQLGPVKVVPYGVLDLTHYTQALDGQDVGRFYGGGGVRASLPLTRLYSDVCSEMFNLNGLNHKIVFGANYYNAYTNVAYSELPQLDRVNDDATDQSVRDIRPQESSYLPLSVANALVNSPLYDPQTYAIRRLVDNRVDTLDDIQVLQASVRQRFQTKRGFPGMEHTVDYITLDLSASFFPDPNRDNFGESVSFLEYASAWNIGDRTTLFSSGWVDPFENGARFFSGGMQYSRPDNTTYFLSFRSIDPLESKAVTAAVTYTFSEKYAISASASYDFGTSQSQSNSLVLARTGTDVRVALGINYDAIIQNFGFTFEVVPNILASTIRSRGGLLNGAAR